MVKFRGTAACAALGVGAVACDLAAAEERGFLYLEKSDSAVTAFGLLPEGSTGSELFIMTYGDASGENAANGKLLLVFFAANWQNSNLKFYFFSALPLFSVNEKEKLDPTQSNDRDMYFFILNFFSYFLIIFFFFLHGLSSYMGNAWKFITVDDVALPYYYFEFNSTDPMFTHFESLYGRSIVLRSRKRYDCNGLTHDNAYTHLGVVGFTEVELEPATYGLNETDVYDEFVVDDSPTICPGSSAPLPLQRNAVLLSLSALLALVLCVLF